MQMEDRKIYIVLSQSGSMVSFILKLITKTPYNHVSISIEDDCKPMYSFGRKYAYFPF